MVNKSTPGYKGSTVHCALNCPGQSGWLNYALTEHNEVVCCLFILFGKQHPTTTYQIYTAL